MGPAGVCREQDARAQRPGTWVWPGARAAAGRASQPIPHPQALTLALSRQGRRRQVTIPRSRQPPRRSSRARRAGSRASRPCRASFGGSFELPIDVSRRPIRPTDGVRSASPTRPSLRARASHRRGVCVAGPPRRGNTRTSNTTPQRARRRARTSRSSTSGHPPRETRWRSPRRRSAPAYFFARSFGQLSNARCCLFRTDGGGPQAVSERSARASAPRARSTQTSRRAPPVLRSLRSRTRVSFEPVVSRAEVPKVVSS